MELRDKIYTIIEDHQPAREPAEIVEEIMAAIEDYRIYTEAQEAEDRRWNEGR